MGLLVNIVSGFDVRWKIIEVFLRAKQFCRQPYQSMQRSLVIFLGWSRQCHPQVSLSEFVFAT